MKILICSTNDNIGGAGRAAYRLLNGLYCAEKDVNMLVLHNNSANELVSCVTDYYDQQNELQKIFAFLGDKVKQKLRNRKWARYSGRKKTIPVHDLSLSYAKNSLKKFNFDILHLHFVTDGFMNFTEPGLKKSPVVWTLHDCYPFTGICHYLSGCNKYKTECGNCPILKSKNRFDLSTNVFRQKKMRYQDLNIHVVTPSKWLGQRVKESALLGHRPVHVIPNGIDTSQFFPISKVTVRKALRLHENKKIILFGAMSPYSDYNKGYAHLKDAINLLEKR